MVSGAFLNANAAEVSPNAQKRNFQKIFCDFCETSALFAFKGFQAP
jgi:hypothetical protein